MEQLEYNIRQLKKSIKSTVVEYRIDCNACLQAMNNEPVENRKKLRGLKMVVENINIHNDKEHASCCFRGEFDADDDVPRDVVNEFKIDCARYIGHAKFLCPVVGCTCQYNHNFWRFYETMDGLIGHLLNDHQLTYEDIELEFDIVPKQARSVESVSKTLLAIALAEKNKVFALTMQRQRVVSPGSLSVSPAAATRVVPVVFPAVVAAVVPPAPAVASVVSPAAASVSPARSATKRTVS